MAETAQATKTRGIVRILTTDVDGNLPLERALRRVKGISFVFARSACIATGLDGRQKIGDMDDKDIKTIENFVKEPQLPAWLLNRRKDSDSGKDMHLNMAGLELQKREDINILKKMRAYRGIRHEQGQPVRGQRTRSTFRTQKAVGVTKKKELARAKAEEKK